MKKNVTTNTFNKGITMDLNPLVTPNNVLTNCLNGTLITYNGNEHALQNDMGNGRVETAYLPEGFVPLGTAELGGIIYIVSYNPLKNKCQIGSFPSPERNISSDEISNIVQSLDNQDFTWDSKTGAKVYYLKKDLDSELKFNPGDKFIVYGHDIDKNYSKFYNNEKYNSTYFTDALNQTIKIDIGTVTDTGKLVIFSNLKQYTTTQGNKYHIYEYEGSSQGTKKPDLDEYRSLVSQPYNIFSSKVSGKLVIIVELIQCNTFDIEISHKFTEINNYKYYTPNITFNFGGEYPYIPYGVKCNLSVNNVSEEFFIDVTEFVKTTIDVDNQNYSVLIQSLIDRSSKIKDIINTIDFSKKNRNTGYILNYTFTPCMNWGALTYLAVSGAIDLDKLGTGYIGLTTWRYYKQKSESLTWGLEVYEEEGYSVTNVSMDFIRLIDKSTKEVTTYTINKKSSYHGIFYDILPLDQEYFRFSNPLVSNTLYLVKIKVTYQKLNENSTIKVTPEERFFYRWMYTSEVFNAYYVTTSDFIKLKLALNPKFKVDYSTNDSNTQQALIYGIINPTTEGKSETDKTELVKSKTSLSCIQTLTNSIVVCNLIVGLENTYNTFYLEVNKNAISIELNKDNISNSTQALIKYTDNEDSNQDQYLASSASIVSDIDSYKLTSSQAVDKSDSILNIPTYVVNIKTTSISPTYKDNVYSFNLQYTSLQLVKTYCTKYEDTLTYSGSLQPLAFDEDTFSSYNLKYSDNGWIPTMLGTYGFQEDGGSSGDVWVATANEENIEGTSINVAHENNVDLNWTTNEKIIEAQQSSGWSNSAVMAVHMYGENGSHTTMETEPTSPLPLDKDHKYEFTQSLTENRGVFGRTRVQLMLKSNNSSYFYPVDFSATSYASQYSEIMTLTKQFFNDYAQFLNNIYRYSNQEFTRANIIPKSIYYMDDCSYTLNIPLNVKSNNLKDNSILKLKLDTENVSLKDIPTILKDDIGTTEEGFENNITYDIPDIDSATEFVINTSDNVSGLDLRNYILNLQTTGMGIGILDYDGKTVIGNTNQSYNTGKLYYLIKDGSTLAIKAANKVPFHEIYWYKDDSGNIITKSLDYAITEQGKENLNNRLTLDSNGLLILKDPPSSEYEMVRDVEDRSHQDEGKVRGFQKVRLLNKYRYYS